MSAAPPKSGAQALPPKAGHLGHIFRLGTLLVVALAVAVIAQRQLRPATFGAQGHFRAAAIGENSRQPVRHLGGATCAECHEHEEVVKKAAAGVHKTIACENCHGPARGHAIESKARRKLAVDASTRACLTCHAQVSGRPDILKLIDFERHKSDWDIKATDRCVSCHDAHSPTDSPETDDE